MNRKADRDGRLERKKKERVTIMKKVKNIFHKIANADPMIWGYVMLNEINRK